MDNPLNISSLVFWRYDWHDLSFISSLRTSKKRIDLFSIPVLFVHLYPVLDFGGSNHVEENTAACTEHGNKRSVLKHPTFS